MNTPTYISPVAKIDGSIPFALAGTWRNSLTLMVSIGIPWLFFFQVIPLFIQVLPLAAVIFGNAPLYLATTFFGSPQFHILDFAFFYLVAPLVNRGMTNIALKVYDGKPFGMRDFFCTGGSLWQFYLGSLIYLSTVFFGFVCLIVPGIVWSMKFNFFSVYIVDKGVSASTALKASARLTHGQKLSLFFLFLQLCLIELVGSFCVIGMIPAQILGALAQVYAYKQCLASQPELSLESPQLPNQTM
jgi:hypothetical protein